MQTPTLHINKKSCCPKCALAGYSKISIRFLDDLAKEWKVEIQHAENKGEYKIDDPDFKCSYRCDGYLVQDNKKYIVEFHEDYFHGNPKIYKPGGICKLRRLTFGELYKKTEEKMYRIKSMGYEGKTANSISLSKPMSIYLKVYLSTIEYFREIHNVFLFYLFRNI